MTPLNYWNRNLWWHIFLNWCIPIFSEIKFFYYKRTVMFKSCHYFGEVSNVYSCHESKCGSFLFLIQIFLNAFGITLQKQKSLLCLKFFPNGQILSVQSFSLWLDVLMATLTPTNPKQQGKGTIRQKTALEARQLQSNTFLRSPFSSGWLPTKWRL